MIRNAHIVCFSLLLPALAALSGCSSAPPAAETKKPQAESHKIQGKVRLLHLSDGTSDAALNGGGPSAFIWEGRQQYRLFSRTTANVVDGNEYIVEGVHAQDIVDGIGDPDQGKNGYPLKSSCERAVRIAWPGMSFDEADTKAAVLRGRMARYPARPIIMVSKITPVSGEPKKDDSEKYKDTPTVTTAADKQKALLVEGTSVLTAPLWEPEAKSIKCKVIINPEGKISELETGAQLCEAIQWDKFRYKPTLQSGKPVNVKTEVEVTYEPRK
ncbi:MAG TPA: hypothetical protein VGK29_02050 [Paludibaculum sp.]|jgi:hypothetical protein